MISALLSFSTLTLIAIGFGILVAGFVIWLNMHPKEYKRQLKELKDHQKNE